jgi:hypothetical protein
MNISNQLKNALNKNRDNETESCRDDRFYPIDKNQLKESNDKVSFLS